MPIVYVKKGLLMENWAFQDHLLHLTVLVGAMVIVPLCRHWIGGPLASYAVTAFGLVILSPVELRHFLFALQTPAPVDPYAWSYGYVQGIGYVTVLIGFMLWIRHIRTARAELGWMASTDGLTRLTNRRQALLLLAHERARAKRYSASLSVIMIDVDRLKPVNDSLGHHAGDALLMHVGEVLKRRLRATDIVARYGGDEFLVVLPGADTQAAIQMAEGFRQAFHDSPAQYGNATIKLLASFGVAEMLPGEDLTSEDLIARADAAVYAVKRTGGNAVTDWHTVTAKPAAAPLLAVVPAAPAL
jgi:diguanylate cyclase (GGDEF)-like protein